MTHEIYVPTTGSAESKLSVGRWFKKVGDPVTSGEPIVEIDSTGVTQEIQAPATGVLTRILVRDGGSIKVGTSLGTITQF